MKSIFYFKIIFHFRCESSVPTRTEEVEDCLVSVVIPPSPPRDEDLEDCDKSVLTKPKEIEDCESSVIIPSEVKQDGAEAEECSPNASNFGAPVFEEIKNRPVKIVVGGKSSAIDEKGRRLDQDSELNKAAAIAKLAKKEELLRKVDSVKEDYEKKLAKDNGGVLKSEEEREAERIAAMHKAQDKLDIERDIPVIVPTTPKPIEPEVDPFLEDVHLELPFKVENVTHVSPDFTAPPMIDTPAPVPYEEVVSLDQPTEAARDESLSMLSADSNALLEKCVNGQLTPILTGPCGLIKKGLGIIDAYIAPLDLQFDDECISGNVDVTKFLPIKKAPLFRLKICKTGIAVTSEEGILY